MSRMFEALAKVNGDLANVALPVITAAGGVGTTVNPTAERVSPILEPGSTIAGPYSTTGRNSEQCPHHRQRR
jgi:hypothetical protein